MEKILVSRKIFPGLVGSFHSLLQVFPVPPKMFFQVFLGIGRIWDETGEDIGRKWPVQKGSLKGTVNKSTRFLSRSFATKLLPGCIQNSFHVLKIASPSFQKDILLGLSWIFSQFPKVTSKVFFPGSFIDPSRVFTSSFHDPIFSFFRNHSNFPPVH